MDNKKSDLEDDFEIDLAQSITFNDFLDGFNNYAIYSPSMHGRAFEKMVESAESFSDYVCVYKIAKTIMNEGYDEKYTDTVGRAFMNSRKLILSWAFTDEEKLEAIKVIGQCQEVRTLCLEIIPRLEDVDKAISLLQYLNFDDQVRMTDCIGYKNVTEDGQSNKFIVSSLRSGTWARIPTLVRQITSFEKLLMVGFKEDKELKNLLHAVLYSK